MSVVELDIYDGSTPNGTALVTLTDSDIGSFKMRKGENELGMGEFTIRRDHPDATAANLAAGNYVKVRYPSIGTDPVFAFWLDEHNDVVLAEGEEGEEILTRGGPGPLAILRNAAFLDEPYAPAPPASDDRGNANAPPGYWMWAQKQYGQILKRFIEEGQNQPGTPLSEVTTDFDRGDDSNGVDWPDIIREVKFPIGTDGLQVYEAFASTGELWVRVTPDLLVSAYYLFRGTDRTSATFASGKVRFVKGTNVNTELVRTGHGVEAATHALVVGMDNIYRRVVSPSYTSGPGRWITVNREEFNDPDVLDKVGATALTRAAEEQDAIEFEIAAGFDAATGLYMPFVHFDTGDLVTIHTGTDPWDYNEQQRRITGFRMELREAARDETTAIAAKSLAIVVELGGGRQGFGDISVDAHSMGDCPFFVHSTPAEMRMRGTYTTIGAGGGSDAGDDAYVTIDHDPAAVDLYARGSVTEEALIAIEGAGNIDFAAAYYMAFNITIAAGSYTDSSYYWFAGGWGVRFPELAADPTTASIEGLVYYNTVTNKLRWYNGTVWADLGGGSGSSAAEDVSITDAGGFYTGTDVEAALQEVGGKLFFVDGGGSVVKFRSGKAELRNNAGTAGLLLDAGGDIDMSGSGYVALGANNYASGGANTDKHYLYGGHGLVVPTLAADPASGASEEGQIYFNTTSQTFRGYDGTVWGELALT